MEYTQAREVIIGVITALYEEYDAWKPLQTAADKRAYDLLGRIYEEAGQIEADYMKRMVLIDAVRAHTEVKASEKWSPVGRPAAELLVTLLLGLKTHRSRKHNWVSALAYAADLKVKPTRGAFRKWISSKEVGGIDCAAEAYRGDVLDPEDIKLEEVAANLVAKIESPEVVQLQIDKSAPAGLAVLVMQRKDDGNAIILRKETKEPQVRKVLSDLGVVPRPKKRRNAVQVQNIEREALLALTRVTLALADGGKVTGKRIDTFVNAYHRLKKVPELVEKYFDGKPGYKTVDPDHEGKGGVIEEKNDFDELDPGRYLAGAREGAFIPYAFKPGDGSANRKAALEYLDSFKRPPVEKAERVENPPTLEPHFEESETKPAKELEKEES